MRKLKLKSRYLLGAALPLAITPLVIAASCGDTVQALTATQLENNVRLGSSREYIDNTYHEQILKTLNPTFNAASYETIYSSTIRDGQGTIAISELARYFILNSVYTDRAFLKSYGQALLEQPQSVLIKLGETDSDPAANPDGTFNKVNYADVNRYRLLEEVPADGLPWIAEPAQSARFDELIKMMLKSDLKSFKNNVYKFAVTYSYLDTTKEDYDKVFRKTGNENVAYRSNTTLDAATESINYLIIKQVLTLKPFYTWKITLSTTDSVRFIGRYNLTLAEVDNLLSVNQTPTEIPFTYTQRNKTLPQHMYTLAHSADNSLASDGAFLVDNFGSFSNLERRVATGYNSLSFYETELQKITNREQYLKAYSGYVYENNLVREDVKLFGTQGNAVDLTRIVGLMPMYQNGKYNVNHLNIPALKRAVYFLNATDLYTDAMTYYLYKETPIQMNIVDEYLRTLAIDSFGLKYVKKP